MDKYKTHMDTYTTQGEQIHTHRWTNTLGLSDKTNGQIHKHRNTDGHIHTQR